MSGNTAIMSSWYRSVVDVAPRAISQNSQQSIYCIQVLCGESSYKIIEILIQRLDLVVIRVLFNAATRRRVSYVFSTTFMTFSIARFVRNFQLPRRLVHLLRASGKMSAVSAETAFQLRTNPLTGESEWIVVEAAEEREVPGKSLLANTSYLDMLNDSRRNEAFHQAIRKTITWPCHVLDIGAGTGLLSMMAARALEDYDSGDGETKGTVSACESYLPMGKLMRRVLQANQMQKKIKLLHKRSDELLVGKDLPCRADVLVSEILDSELLGEGLIPTLRHAHDLLLVEHSQTVPYRATVFGQIVECAFLHELHDLKSRESFAKDGVRLVPQELDNILSIRHKQHPMHCDALSEEMTLLSEPFKVFEFDFWRKPEEHREIDISVKATNDGNVHAVISWWVLQLDENGSIFYSTAPNWVNSCNVPNGEWHAPDKKTWCDHWKQCVWFTNGTGVPVSKNELITFQASHDDISISYSFGIKTLCPEFSHSVTDTKLILSPEKIGTYGDRDWRLSYITALKNMLQKKSCPLCVVADDSVFLTLSAACLSKGSAIVSMLPGLKDVGPRYLESVSHFNNVSNNQIKVIGKKAACLTMDNLSGRKIDLLIAEPFYCGIEGMLPWHSLRFWKERSQLNYFLSEDALIVPCKGILKACAMSLPNLWNSRRSLREIESFNHEAVNEALGASSDKGGPCFPFSIWQCGDVEELSHRLPVMEFNFLDNIHACSGKTEVKFIRNGVCLGVALWIDWVLDDEDAITISSSPENRHWKQGVKLLGKPVKVNAGQTLSASLEAVFDPSSGELEVEFSL